MGKFFVMAGGAALCVCIAQNALAQIAQNPVACARLRSDMDTLVQDLMVRGRVPLNAALYAAMQMAEMRRMTGDPCYMPPPASPPPPAAPRIVHPQAERN